ncbi:catechol 2,3-dioxygenase-like lactoylglutathione lyase family enzyme [Paenibacillus sp. JGP012]|jgi:catechol 2,3-dioxygenase-like lactoylglutathione lyase family enzyme|uniref:Catechol 2,3-dioxygenase-like lactoylglutathione lyase family enzyme n=2 Tax=Paenibacillus TaxID=44249 RepID=A0A2V4VH16_PAEBA|nr:MULTISPECIES: VOC family protein [Paenibacillus]MBB6024093.1 catechol 2,3-dioxygenase-like lactoylglutathione lyase family enzyme [Paenibacillus sp. JGP012]MCK6074805.1 VOC family protein [Paenibacillus silvae]MCK6147720.1 VOC family protein [Paenibacillus silvae]MCK6266018.1 VOC family protein [Paenibacillus silvae]PYE45482.1 catechol 2,3-dioxygenase-like lactoylglutathione lyase family enzyme [Paenibacillus barcinonensis]
MIRYAHIHHVSLAVRDLQTAKKFYSGLLGMQEIERPPFRSTGAWYAIGSQQLHLLQHPEGHTLREAGIDTTDGHFALWVVSYSETIAWLEQQGIEYEARPDSVAGFAQIFILDPDRNIIEFGAPYGS